MAKKPANMNAWKATAEVKAREDGYADPAEMVIETEQRMQAANWHMYPWKNGTWVSVGGTIYRGNGGSQRDEYFWYQKGPWLLLDEFDYERIRDTYRDDAKEADKKLKTLRTGMRKLLGSNDD